MSIPIRTRLPALCVLALLVVPAAGCAGFAGATMPKVTVDRARLQTATVRQVTVQVDFTVENPYAVPLPAVGMDYQLWLTGVELAAGKAQVQQTIPANGSAPLTTTLTFGPLQAIRVAARLGFGKRSYRIKGTFRVRAPVGEIGVGFEHRGKLSGGSLIKRLIPGLGARPRSAPTAPICYATPPSYR